VQGAQSSSFGLGRGSERRGSDGSGAKIRTRSASENIFRRVSRGGSIFARRKTQSQAQEPSVFRVADPLEGTLSKVHIDLQDTVISVAFSPDSSSFVAGGNGKEARIHSTHDGTHIATLQAQSGITSVLFAQIGVHVTLLLGTFDGNVVIYDLETKEELVKERFHEGHPIAAMSINEDGDVLAVGGGTSDVILYKLKKDMRQDTDTAPSQLSDGQRDSENAVAPTAIPASTPEGAGRKVHLPPISGAEGVRARVGDDRAAGLAPLPASTSAEQTAAEEVSQRRSASPARVRSEFELGIAEAGRTSHGGNVTGVQLDRTAGMLVVAGESRTVDIHSVLTKEQPINFLRNASSTSKLTAAAAGMSRQSSGTKTSWLRGAAAAATAVKGPALGGRRKSGMLPTFEDDPQAASLLRVHKRASFTCAAPVHCISLSQQVFSTQALEGEQQEGAGSRVGWAQPAQRLVRSALAVGTSTHTEIWSIFWQRHRAGVTILPWQVEPLRRIDCTAITGGVSFSMDASKLAIAGDEMVSLHSTHSGAVLNVYRPEARVRCVALSTSGQHVAFGGFDKHATLYRTNAGAEMLRLPGPKGNSLVRSVHQAGSKMVMGGEHDGSGFVRVYSMGEASEAVPMKLHEWATTKAVWCTRISPDTALCAVAGFDMCVALYSLDTGAKVHVIQYRSADGPAFVWTCDWAVESGHLAVGCWDKCAYVYTVEYRPGSRFSPADGESGGALGGSSAVEHVAVREVQRKQRKDRVYAVAMDATGTKLAVGGRDKAVALFDVATGSELWCVHDSDFVYTVALDPLGARLAYGGMSKTVYVVDGATGARLRQRPAGGTVWSVSLNGDGSRVAYGGELELVSMIDVDNDGQELLLLPTQHVVYDVRIESSSFCYTAGDHSNIYGRGGRSCGWREGPSFDVVASLVRGSHLSDEQRLTFLAAMLKQHPTIVNQADYGTHTCMLKMLVETTSDPAILNLVLSVNTIVGLIPDREGKTALDVALEQGNRTSVRKILRALRAGSISRAPGSIEQVMRLFASLANSFPRELLRFVTHIPTEQEPELFSMTPRSDNILLQHSVVAGSMERAPIGLWDDVLRRLEEAMDREVGVLDRNFGDDNTPPGSPARAARVAGGSVRVPPPQQSTRVSETLGGGQQAWHIPGNNRDAGAFFSGLLGTLAEGEGEGGQGGDVGVNVHPGFAGAPGVSGVKAMRVPLPNLAGWVHMEEGESEQVRPSHLEVIVRAAVRTGDYKVFESPVVSALMDYKWKTFARDQFRLGLLQYTAHMAIIFVYASALRAASALGDEELIARLIDWTTPDGPFLCIGWVWTAIHTVFVVYSESGQVMHAGLGAYLADEWNVVDLIRVVLQALVSVFFALICLVPGSLRETFMLYPGLSLSGVSHEGHDHTCATPDPLGRCLEDLAEVDEMVRPFVFDGVVLEQQWRLLLNAAGLLVVLTILKVFNYMRGFAQLGALVQMIQSILKDMVPFMVVLGISTLGFGFAMTIIPAGQRTLDTTIWTTINMALYSNFDRDFFYHGGWYSATLVQMFQFVVQIVLLNLLIAIMADSYRNVQERTVQAQRFERARVITDMEASPQFFSSFIRRLGLNGSQPPSWVDRPRWLHILANDDQADEDDDD